MSKIPTIDISALFGADINSKMNVAQQIDAACRKNGFFQVSNHGVEIKTAREHVREFFKKLTQEQKRNLATQRYNPQNSNTHLGYRGPDVGSGREEFFIGSPAFNAEHELIKNKTINHEPQVWPGEDILPGFRKALEEYYLKMLELSRVILKGFALALCKDENFWDHKVKYDDTMTTMVMLYYPFKEDIVPVNVEEDGTQLRLVNHKDWELITILLQ